MSPNPLNAVQVPVAKSLPSAKHVVIGLAGLWIFLSILWLLLHPYAGMRHDARLYTLQALGHIAPNLYGGDIFFRFGSQDSYTLFTPIYAQLGRWLGLEHAAALLTAIAQLLFLAACWWLAKKITTAIAATITLGLILILPGNYGSDFVFTYFETFITPRLLAEGLTLLSLINYLSRRGWLAGTLLLGALLIHPVIAMAGVAFIIADAALQHPKIFRLSTLIGLLVIVPILLSPPGVTLRFDDEWLVIVNARSPYLFLQNWMYADWARLAVPAITLWLSTLMAPTAQQRAIAKSALLMGGGGLLVTLVGNDLLRLTIVTQGQAWRWLWLSTLLALLLLLPLMQQLWIRNKAGRATVLLLIAAWLVRNESSSLGLIVFAAAAGVTSLRNIGIKQETRMYLGSAALLTLTVIWKVAMNLLLAGHLVYTYHLPNWIDLVRGVCEDGLIPLLCLGSLYLAFQSRLRLQIIGTACALLVFTVLGWYSWQNWTYQEYPPAVVEEMKQWRELIPAGEDVLWMDGPVPTWLTLQRPSYISSIQATVTLFSRPAALTLKQRSQEVALIFPDAMPLQWTGKSEAISPSTTVLSEICARIPVRFVVTEETLDTMPLATASAKLPAGYRSAKLYGCERTT